MAICMYCGDSAGLFRKVHPRCLQAHDSGTKEILSLATSMLATPLSVKALADKTKEIASVSYVKEGERHALELKGWEAAIEQALDAGVLSEEQDRRLDEAKKEFSFSEADIRDADNGVPFERIVKSAVLRDLMNGIIPTRMKTEHGFPINFQKGEQIVWAFNNCEYFEHHTYRKTVGTSHGFNVRVIKGLYYSTREFESHPVERSELVRVAVGLLVVTDRDIYFDGSTKSFRIPYKKMVSFESYGDGIGVMRDASNAKLQVFITDDGWFTYNLVTNLARLSN